MKRTNFNKLSTLLIVVMAAMALGLSGCGKKKSKKTTAVSPTGGINCVNGVCQPIVNGQNALFRAAGYALSDPNFVLVLDINTQNNNPGQYLNNGQYQGGYQGDIVAVGGYMRAINPNNTNMCLPLDGEYDITTTMPGSMSGWDIFYSIGIDMRHRQTGNVYKAWVEGGFFRFLNPALTLPSGQFSFGLWSTLSVTVHPACQGGEMQLAFGF